MKPEIVTAYPDARTERLWFDFLPVSSYPSHYTSPGFFKEPYWVDQSPFAVLVRDGEQIVGVATGLRKGKQVVCGLDMRPQVSVAHGADRGEVAENLAAGLSAAAEGGESGLITLHCPERFSDFKALGFSERRAAGASEMLMLDLSKGAEAVFKGFSQSRRADLRKAMRENQLQIAPVETEDELAELYQIHRDWCARKQIEPDTWEMMRAVFANPDHHRILVAKHDGRVIAGSYFRFCRGGLVEYAANNSMPEYQHLRPNDLLVWRSIEWSCAEGFRRYSLGGSHLFLRRFGGEPLATYRYRLDRTFLKQHERREAIRELAVKTYLSLPASARQTIKRIAGRG